MDKPLPASSAAVTGIAVDYPAGHVVAEHQHDCCQLLYAAEGILRVEAATGRWMVPPTTAVWLQPHVAHRLVMRGPVRVHAAFIDAAAAPGLPAGDCVIHVSPLLRELVGEVARLGLTPARSRRGDLLAALLLEEMAAPQALPFELPWPADARVAGVCAALAAEPAHAWAAAGWAASLAMSTKTFHRHFEAATGMTFGRWRQQLRLLVSVESLLGGASVLRAALDSGYASQSAYAAAFRKAFGVTPSSFVATARA